MVQSTRISTSFASSPPTATTPQTTAAAAATAATTPPTSGTQASTPAAATTAGPASAMPAIIFPRHSGSVKMHDAITALARVTGDPTVQRTETTQRLYDVEQRMVQAYEQCINAWSTA